MQEMNNTNIVNEAKMLLDSALKEFSRQNFKLCEQLVLDARNTFMDANYSGGVSICYSILACLKYCNDKNAMQEALSLLDDAKFLAVYTQNDSAKLMFEFFSGYINLREKNIDLAKLHYENAKNYAIKSDEFNMLDFVAEELASVSSIKEEKSKKRDPLISLVKIAQSVGVETDLGSLLKVITEETKEAIQADRCTVFLYDKEKNELWSMVALGLESSEIRFTANKGLAGHVVKTGETINIKDAYNDSRFNKEIDLQTGYRTKTILCMPIKNLNQEVIGAFQVLNKIEGCFTSEDEDLLVAIGSSAGVALENTQLFEKQKEMYSQQKIVFDSFIETLAASIDARDKITAGHSSRVRMYSSLIAKKFNLEEKMVEIIEKAATLHDIGKIGIKDSVLQKEGKLTDEEYTHIQEHVSITHDILSKIHMSDDFKMIADIACAHHEKIDGKGYYKHLSGREIPFGGRILAVADVFDAITSKRHYRDKMPMQKVISILMKDAGKHFDNEVVEQFLALPVTDIIEVFLTENHLKLKNEDKEILSKYTLKDYYNLASVEIEMLNQEQEQFITLFNKYYIGNTEVNWND